MSHLFLTVILNLENLKPLLVPCRILASSMPKKLKNPCCQCSVFSVSVLCFEFKNFSLTIYKFCLSIHTSTGRGYIARSRLRGGVPGQHSTHQQHFHGIIWHIISHQNMDTTTKFPPSPTTKSFR